MYHLRGSIQLDGIYRPLSNSPGQMSRGTPYWDCRGCSKDNWEAIMKTTKHFLRNAVGCIQLCAGHDAGCEAAVHVMAQIFDDN